VTDVVLQRRVKGRGIPAPATLRRFARAALAEDAGELTLRIVGNAESRALNHRYRGKDKPTNVLSFPATASVGERDTADRALGDLVLCAPVIAREAREQKKTLRAHWAHMIVHGCLHLRGYDHEAARDAAKMEARERKILKGLGFPDPYG